MPPSERRAAFSKTLLCSSPESSFCLSLLSVRQWSFLCETSPFSLTAKEEKGKKTRRKKKKKKTLGLYFGQLPAVGRCMLRLRPDSSTTLLVSSFCSLCVLPLFLSLHVLATLPLPLSLPSRYLSPSYSTFPSLPPFFSSVYGSKLQLLTLYVSEGKHVGVWCMFVHT